MMNYSNTKPTRGIYLVGFSGSGKSTVANNVADKFGCEAIDIDDVIVKQSGMSIPEIFKKEGEAGFRIRETEALHSCSQRPPFVVATGGGTVVRAENRVFMAEKGWIVFLEAQATVLHTRIQQQLKTDPKAIRPLLDAVYPLDQIRALKHSRQSAYSLADWTVHTDRLTPEQVVDEIVRAVDILEHSTPPTISEEAEHAPLRHSLDLDSPPPIIVAAGPWPYQVIVDWNQLPAVGEYINRVLPHTRRAAILTDATGWGRLANVVRDSLNKARLEVHVREVSSDETRKTIAEVNSIHDWLLGIPLRRDDVLIVIGGGAVDDVGGFAASTYMRGVALVKVPTSLEGMIDTSIGGKTALNHARGRNLIGTFYHPRLVITDVSLLRDEPPQEVRGAWAEVVKYGMLESSLLRAPVEGITLFDLVKRNATDLMHLDRRSVLDIVARCVALKAHVVAGDERDSGQHRILLNYGHTVGHALEAATNYHLSHGEAVAIGMSIAARLAVRLGLAVGSVVHEQDLVLKSFGLPTRLPAVDTDVLLLHIHKDKKVFGDTPRWILPTEIGRAVISSNVREQDVLDVLHGHWPISQ